MSRFRYLIVVLLMTILAACRSPVPAATVFDPSAAPPPPDYALSAHWAALPTKQDEADRTPEGLKDLQSRARADVFYVHPTIYSKVSKNNNGWNADVADADLNKKVDDSAIRNQAAIFNAAGKVYAPRYRQAHLNVFRQRGSEIAEGALDLAYTDVLAAFDYYLENFNEGRPIVIAAHSQGTVHAARLLSDRFVGQPLSDRLVVAYLVGMPVPADAFTGIPVCEEATATGCFVSWRTFRKDYVPKRAPDERESIAVVNPLNWSTEKDLLVPKSANLGGVLYNFEKVLPELVDAEIRGNLLYTSKPRFFGDVFFNRKNYHIGDFNLFWMNVRENAVDRVNAFTASSR